MRRALIVLVAAAAVFAAALIQADAWQKSTPEAAPKPTPAEQKAQDNYRKACQPCHGPEGKSPLPNMTLADGEWKHGGTIEQIAKTIADGVPGTLMLPNKDKFSKEEIVELAKLVRSFDPKLKK
ncbi:MAG TPA: c-type cytochrome [Vicinamibacterales bacterium]|nr:c-type cytochrome [Vicinamibacterales bacterium]